jgi:hypothetical protein
MILILANVVQAQPSFTGPIEIADVGSSHLIIGDMNGDATPDILLGATVIAVNRIADITSFTLIDTQATFGGVSDAVADVDGRDGEDIVSAGGGVFLALNQGLSTPTFQSIQLWNRNEQYGIAAGDLNGDETIDIVAAGSTLSTFQHWMAVFENQETSPPTFLRHDLPDTEVSQRFVAVADLNQDNQLDIIASSDGLLTWRENRTTQTLTFDKHLINLSPLPVGYFQQPVPVDFDADGDLDILVNTKAQVLWYENVIPATPAFERYAIYFDGTGNPNQPFQDFNVIRTKPLDFDLDGDMDVVLTGRKLVILENAGDNITFIPHELQTPEIIQSFSVDTGDLNGDGYPDIVVSFEKVGGGAVAIYINRFGEPVTAARDWNLYTFRRESIR